ncbi:hypothetical protein SNEBB_005022 [Seison nebaliae]|nr:hypothetical protein SNEBB_005022 [Seison nebaliae]
MGDYKDTIAAIKMQLEKQQREAMEQRSIGQTSILDTGTGPDKTSTSRSYQDSMGDYKDRIAAIKMQLEKQQREAMEQRSIGQTSILDTVTGSDKTSMSQSLGHETSFTGKTGNLSIDSFNGNRTNLEEVPIVLANLEKGDITLKVKAFEVEFIGRLSMANIPVEMQKTEQFKNIRENSGKPEIDVLIGADSYNDIV